jgi:hypothetical protein
MRKKWDERIMLSLLEIGWKAIMPLIRQVSTFTFRDLSIREDLLPFYRLIPKHRVLHREFLEMPHYQLSTNKGSPTSQLLT